MELILIFLLPFMVLALIPANIAAKKGGEFGGWMIYGTLLFPVAFIHSLLMTPTEAGLDRMAEAAGKRRCPHCAEFIHTTALQCRFCGNPVGRALRALQEGITLEEVNAEIERRAQPLRLSRGHYPKSKGESDLDRKRSRYGLKPNPNVPLPPVRKGVYPKVTEDSSS